MTKARKKRKINKSVNRKTAQNSGLAKVAAQCSAEIPIAIGMVKIATFAKRQNGRHNAILHSTTRLAFKKS